MIIGATASLCAAGTLTSGDRAGGKGKDDARNFDWTRPLPEEIAANPDHASSPRPYIRDVGRPTADDSPVVEPGSRSMWTRPRTEEISANPTSPWGTRPYLR